MRHRVAALITAGLSVMLVAAGSALATDEPPTAPGSAAPSLSAIRGALQQSGAACRDPKPPRAGFGPKAAREARSSHVLRGTAHDGGTRSERRCGVALVTLSVARKQGTRCAFLVNRRLSRPRSCQTPRWVIAAGTNRWHLALPKRLPRGRYLVRTRAIDFAGNVQSAGTGTRHLSLR
jgi:hypothetical protein